MERTRTIRRRLMSVTLLTSAAGIALTCAALIVHEYLSSRAQALEQLHTLARVIATNSTAALAFDDAVGAEQLLASLHSEPSVMAAALYDKNGRLFARYGRDDRARTYPTTVSAENYAFGEGYLEQTVAVREQRDQNLGFLYLRSNLRNIYDRLWRYVEIAAAIMIVSLLAAYLLAHLLQQRIARPLRALVDTARAISERSDFSGRAPPAEEGEFKLLTDAFNEMLNRLQAQLARLDLLQRTTRAIGERQDLHSIFQVILRKLDAGRVRVRGALRCILAHADCQICRHAQQSPLAAS
jgi:nitrogen fixation/metabolism regulation signal transduction histidine kinase